MNEQQFNILIQEIQITTKTIVDKLEEVRCGGIDIEDRIKELEDKVEQIMPALK